MTFNLDDYEPVSARLARWIESIKTSEHHFPVVITEMTHREDDWCVFKASLYIGREYPEGVRNSLIATGWAEEHVTERGVNSTSHVENCETSAVGRALANAGFAGSDPSKRASREEMTKVQRSGGQPQTYSKPSGIATAKQRQFIQDLVGKHKFVAALPDDLSFSDASRLIEALKSGKMLPEFDAQNAEEPF